MESAWARITIGGRAPRKGLVMALRAQGFKFKMSDLRELMTEKSIPSGFSGTEISIDDKGRLMIEEDDAAWGRFTRLEDKLNALGVAFDRESESTASFPPEYYQSRPDADVESSGAYDEHMVEVAEIRKLLNACQDIGEARKQFGDMFPDVPDLPALELVKDEEWEQDDDTVPAEQGNG